MAEEENRSLLLVIGMKNQSKEDRNRSNRRLAGLPVFSYFIHA